MNTPDPTRSATNNSGDAPPRSLFNLQDALERFEKDFLHNVLLLAEGNQRQAAAMMGLSLPELQKKLRYYDMS